MENFLIVTDSSSNLTALRDVPFAFAPLKIITAEKEFVDSSDLNVADMIDFFARYKGRSKTSCPNPSDWLDAFGDAKQIFCITITSGLSGSYNSACIAKQMYEAEHPDCKVHVIDSLSAGPELVLIAEKLAECVHQGMSFCQIQEAITAYTQTTGLAFMLQSLKNFAANGRVSPAVAKIAGVLGIRIVGKASSAGTLEPFSKSRGEAKALNALVSHITENGLHTGKVRIAHCCNEEAAIRLKDLLLARRPNADISIHTCRGLCSYYAEYGGLLVGYEKF